MLIISICRSVNILVYDSKWGMGHTVNGNITNLVMVTFPIMDELGFLHFKDTCRAYFNYEPRNR